MPRYHQPVTLIRRCLQAITLSFDLICYGCQDLNSIKTLLETDTYRDVKGPFTEWPGEILYEILDVISEKYTLNKKHLHMLIQPQLQTINLSFGTGDVVSGFPLIQERCQNIKHLNISYLRHLHPKMLMELIPCLTNLISLDLRMTLVADESLGLIGKNCKQLVSLNLSGTSITDRGLVSLALDEDATKYCQKLNHLNVSETWVSHGGAAIILVYLPQLREFEYEKTLEAIELVYNWGPTLEQTLLTRSGARMGKPTDGPYSLELKTVISSADSLTEKTLEAAVSLCPNLTSFSVSNAQITNEHLYKLMILENLTNLSLTNCDGLTIDFEMGVLPVLSACGEHIKNLILTNFTYVSITDIGRTCPRLQNVAFSRIVTFNQETPNPEWFNNLKAMELWGDIDIEIDPNIIRQLVLYSPNLKNLLFNSCHVLTDSLFEELIKENPMKYLSHLTLDTCYNITTKTLNNVLDAENDLSVLRVWSCQNVGKENKSQIALRILQENMDVYFDWYQYEPNY